jgi:hypothetical protein
MAAFGLQKRGENVVNSVVIVVISLVAIARIFISIEPFQLCENHKQDKGPVAQCFNFGSPGLSLCPQRSFFPSPFPP